MKPYKHQQEVIDKDPKYSLFAFGCGCGKTFLALSLAEGNTLVICPKTIRDAKTWENQLRSIVVHKISFLKVISKEEFKRDYESLPKFNTVIIDEVHTVLGLTPNIRYKNKMPIPKASQLFEACREYLKHNNPERLYLCTATPVKNPMSVLAAAWLLGKDWNFYNWRDTFMVRLPMPGRAEIWGVKKDSNSKDQLAKAVKSLGFTGKLSDFADVPPQTHIVKHIPLSASQEKRLKEIPMEYPDPIVLVGKQHQIEQGVLKGNEFEKSETFESGKIDAILDLCEQYDKVLVFAKYTEQIELITGASKKSGVPVYTLTGATKDRGALIKEAEASDRCLVVCQSQISAGYELPSFRCTIYASESWSIVDHVQSVGRSLRMNKLAPNLYVYLVSGKVDKAVRDSIINKKDFDARVYLKL
jgi:Helicase conserved C-terminal domain